MTNNSSRDKARRFTEEIIWIPFEERLPTREDADSTRLIRIRFDDGSIASQIWSTDRWLIRPTHWAPIP